MICPACQTTNADPATVCTRCGAALGRSPLAIKRGTVLASRYEVLSLLGHGGMGTVYKAHDRMLDEVVAIKTLRAEVASDPEVVRRFVSEIKLARKIRHENVCAIHEFGEDGSQRFIAMEFVDGVDLRHVLRKQGRLPTEQAFSITLQVTRGLQAIHECGIIHRDLKTSNLMLDLRGLVRLMDFGIAKESGSEATLAGMVLGTPEYMSPEQAQGHRVDFRSDIYALGIVIFEIFTGHPPFRGEGMLSVILKQISAPPPLDEPEARFVPRPLVPVIRRALEKSPAARFGSAAELCAAMEGALEEWRRTRGPDPERDPVLEPPERGGLPAGRALGGAAVPKAIEDRASPLPMAGPTIGHSGMATVLPGATPTVVPPEAPTRLETRTSLSELPTLLAGPDGAAPTLVEPPPRPPRVERGPVARRAPPVSRGLRWPLVVVGLAVLGASSIVALRRLAPVSAPSPAPSSLPGTFLPSPSFPPSAAPVETPPLPARVSPTAPVAPATPRASRPAPASREDGRGPAPSATPSSVAPVPPPPTLEPPAPAEVAPAAPPPAEPALPSTSPIALPPTAGQPVPDPGNRRPEYPPAELAAGVEGTVVLKILLSETGEVLSAEPLAGDEPFVTAALTAAREWRYAPVRVEGRPRSVYFVVRIPFRAKKR